MKTTQMRSQRPLNEPNSTDSPKKIYIYLYYLFTLELRPALKIRCCIINVSYNVFPFNRIIDETFDRTYIVFSKLLFTHYIRIYIKYLNVLLRVMCPRWLCCTIYTHILNGRMKSSFFAV